MKELVRILGNNKALVVKPSLAVEKVVSWEKAVTLLMFRDAYSVLNRDDKVIRSESFQMPMPLVVARNSYSVIDRKFKAGDYASKRSIRIRDNYTCQYCGGVGATIDHITPKALGGRSTWGNMCVACFECNSAKGHKTLSEIGYPTPVIPDSLPVFRPTRLQEALFEALEMAV